MSARKFMVIAFSSTYCVCLIGSLIATILKITPVEMFLGLFAGFTPMVVLMNEWYFKREDRKEESNGPKDMA